MQKIRITDYVKTVVKEDLKREKKKEAILLKRVAEPTMSINMSNDSFDILAKRICYAHGNNESDMIDALNKSSLDIMGIHSDVIYQMIDRRCSDLMVTGLTSEAAFNTATSDVCKLFKTSYKDGDLELYVKPSDLKKRLLKGGALE